MKEVVVSCDAIPEGFCGFKKGSKVIYDLLDELTGAVCRAVSRHHLGAEIVLNLEGSSILQVLVDDNEGQDPYEDQALYEDLERSLLQVLDDFVILRGANGQASGGCSAGVIPDPPLRREDEMLVVAQTLAQILRDPESSDKECIKAFRSIGDLRTLAEESPRMESLVSYISRERDRYINTVVRFTTISPDPTVWGDPDGE